MKHLLSFLLIPALDLYTPEPKKDVKPIMMFVLCGYEHSIANMYFIPAAIFTADLYGMDPGTLGWGSFFVKNLLPVTLGNLVGGGVCVAGSYWFIYGKRKSTCAESK